MTETKISTSNYKGATSQLKAENFYAQYFVICQIELNLRVNTPYSKKTFRNGTRLQEYITFHYITLHYITHIIFTAYANWLEIIVNSPQ